MVCIRCVDWNDMLPVLSSSSDGDTVVVEEVMRRPLWSHEAYVRCRRVRA